MSGLPKEPGRRPQLGFLYFPPLRVQGLSSAGEETAIQIPELDVCFDIGLCPRATLASNYVALTHGHMDHAAGLAYYFSQRYFQGMGVGTVVCPKALEQPIHNLMAAWVDIESQKTPYKVIALDPDEEIELKPKTYLRGFQTNHTVPSLGYVVIEKRSKLKPEYQDLPQEKIVELKKQGIEFTHTVEVPLVCYTGDTKWGLHFERPDLIGARVLITECTFTDPEHRGKAEIGKHLHLDHVAALVRRSTSEAVVLVHLSRRTPVPVARRQLAKALSEEDLQRVHILCDNRTNKARYERQTAEAEGAADEA